MSSADPTLHEKGYPRPEAPVNKELPAGDATWPLPHYLQYNTFFNFVSRTYNWTHDEALRDSVCNSDAMWRDLVISTAIVERIRPVCQLEHQFESRNPSDPAEKLLQQDITEIFEDIPRFQDLKFSLLMAMWPGRAGVQVLTEWPDKLYPRSMMFVRDWSPINGDSLVFKFDGQPGILCNPQLLGQPGVHYIEGRGGCAKFLTPAEEEVTLIHEFEPMAAGYYHNEMAGSVHGSGYRGRVYWYWWLKHNLMKIMMDFTRKVGNGFFLFGHDASNRQERTQAQVAMEQQAGQPIIYVPLSQGRTLEETLKHLQTSLTGADFQWNVINALNEMIRDAILGNTAANKSAPAGIGGSQADHMGFTDDERVKYDATALEHPLQKLTNMICKYIRPGVRPPKFRFLTDKRQPGEIMESAGWFAQMGGTIPKPWAQEQLGIPDPKDGEEVLGMVQNQQATALGAVPGGVPMAGPAGPEPGMEGQAPGQEDADTQALMAQVQPIPMSRTAQSLADELAADIAQESDR